MRNKLVCIFAACLLAVSAAALPVMAAEGGTGFTPSVTNQPAPEVQNENTEVTVGGEVVDITGSGIKIVITPISKAEDAPDDETTNDLYDAAGDVAAKNNDEFVFKTPEDEKSFNDFKTQAEANGKVLACSNLFDLSVVDDDGNKVEIDKGTFTLAVPDADNLVLVMHKHDGTWAIVDFINNGDGTITFTLDGLSPIAFFKQADAAKVIENLDTSSTTSTPGGDTSSTTPGDTSSTTPGDTSSTTSGDTSSTTSGDTSSTTSGNTSSNTSSNTNSGKSPQTGVEGGSIFLVSAIVTGLAGAAFVVKAKKE